MAQDKVSVCAIVPSTCHPCLHMSVPLHLRLSLFYPRHQPLRSRCRSVEPCDDPRIEVCGSVAKTTSSTVTEPTNMTNCPKQVHQPQHNHGRTDHCLKQINHGKVIGQIMVGYSQGLWCPSEYHKWRWLLKQKRRRQMDTMNIAG